MEKWLIFGIFLMLISHVSAFMCSEYAGQEISRDIFWNECAWYLSVPGIVLGLILIIWPTISIQINYFILKHFGGEKWKEKMEDQEKSWTRLPFIRIQNRIGGIIFLVCGLVILILQIIY